MNKVIEYKSRITVVLDNGIIANEVIGYSLYDLEREYPEEVGNIERLEQLAVVGSLQEASLIVRGLLSEYKGTKVEYYAVKMERVTAVPVKEDKSGLNDWEVEREVVYYNKQLVGGNGNE